MTSDPKPDRTKVTFSQAERLAPLPEPLKLGELSQQIRALLWKLIYEGLERDSDYPTMGGYRYITGSWKTILYDEHVFTHHKAVDSFSTSFTDQVKILKELILSGQYNDVFDFLQNVMRHRKHPYLFRENVRTIFMISQAATQWMSPVERSFQRQRRKKAPPSNRH